MPKLLIKPTGEPEYDITDKVDDLEYLGPANDGSSPQWTNNYNQVAGLDGQLFVSENYDKSTINERFAIHFFDYYDFVLAKHQFYRLFGDRKLLRIRTDHNPLKVAFVYPTAVDIAPTNGADDVMFTMPFDNPSGYLYSLYRSDQMPIDEAQFGEERRVKQSKYHFKSNSFTVYNPSDITIDPYEQRHDLKITMKYSGGSIKLQNTTTNTEWQYKKGTGSAVVLDGINATVNNNTVNTDTDWGYITLAPGDNKFSVTGASNVDITFSFPFIYLA